MRMKTCRGKFSCGEVKDPSEFDKDCAYCKSCRKKRITAARHKPELNVDLNTMLDELWIVT